MLEILYTDCDLPQPLFEKASVTGDLSHIVKEPGDVDLDARAAAWMAINDEYLQLTGDTVTAGYSCDLLSQAEVGGKIVIVQMLLNIASDYPSERALSHLREYYPGIAFPSDDPEQLEADLDMVGRKLERDSIEYEQLGKRLDAAELQQKGEEGEERQRPTYETFARLKIAINDHKKMVYDFTRLTTRDYAILVKSLRDISQKEPQAA